MITSAYPAVVVALGRHFVIESKPAVSGFAAPVVRADNILSGWRIEQASAAVLHPGYAFVEKSALTEDYCIRI